MMLRRKFRWVALLGLGVCLLAAVPALYLLYSGLIAERVRLAGGLVDSARAVMGDYEHAAVDGDLIRTEAKARAQAALRGLAGGPFQLALFPDGTLPAGWPGKGRSVAAVGLFEPWGWMVAVSADTADLRHDFTAEAAAFVLFLAVLLAAAWPLSAFVSDQLVGPLENLAARMGRMAGGDIAEPVPGQGRADEFGAMARALEHFRRNAAAILEHDERLSGIMDNVGEAIVVVSENGVVEDHNPAAEHLFGCDGVALTGQVFSGLFTDADQGRVLEALVAQRTSPTAEDGGGRSATRMEALGIAAGPSPGHAEVRREVSLAVTRLEVHGRRSFICVLADMTGRLRYERELLRLATRDRLTGLPNRALVGSLVDAAVERARRSGRRFALLFLDLSRFKLITDTLGHEAGDILLQEVARRIQGAVRAADTVGRIGTDDFAILLDEVADGDEAAEVATRILAAFETPVALLGTEHYVRPSVGIALYPEHADAGADLLRAADTALYAAKRQGGRRHAFFQRAMADQARRHLALDRDLRSALVRQHFQLHYQPKVLLADRSLQGFEALLRWNRPDHGMVPPGDFIPVAEETGFIVPLGDWVLDEACRQQRRWQDAGLDPLPVAVNISPRHLRQRSAADFLAILERHRLPTSLIELEITEGAVMQDMDHALAVLGALKAAGVRVAVDDFGTGHSSLSYLKRLPITTLKIDRSFINGIPHEREDAGIVATIIAMAEMLGLEVVAEGVEHPEQAHFLNHHACLMVQGWLTGRPVPAEQAAALLADREHRTS